MRRTAWLLAVMVLVSSLTFVVFHVLPSRPLPDDRSLIVQLGDFLQQTFIHFDLGHQWQRPHTAVTVMLGRALPATLWLIAGATVFAVLIGLPVKTYAARHPRSPAGRAITVAAVFAVTAPLFWIGLVALRVFEPHIGWIRVPALFCGSGCYDSLVAHPGQWISAMLFPWIVLSIPLAGMIVRLLSASMQETLAADYIRTARAKGLTSRQVLRHARLPAMSPVVALVGVNAATLISNVVLLESVFGLPGIGTLARTAMDNSDLPVIQGTVICGAFIVALANLLADVALAWLDPHVRV